MTPLEGLRFTDRDLIEKIVENYFIVDYGFITEINPDGTVNVTHAKRGVTIDGKVMPETQTSGVEVLTIACAEFSIKLTPKKGDNVLLLGLRNYLDHAGNIKQATPNDIFLHYQQNTMKAVPLSLFDDNAKVKLEIDGGNLNLICSKFIVKGSGGSAALEVTP